MRITKQVYLVGGGNYGMSHPGDCNIYLVDCGSTRVLIDAGCGLYPQGIIDNIEADGFDPLSIDVILLTHNHWDHGCGCSHLKKVLRARIAAHPGCAHELREGLWSASPAMALGMRVEPTEVDIPLEHGRRVAWGDVEFEIVGTPGHTANHVSIVANTSDRRVLFTGDAIWGEGTIGGISAHSDFQAWLRSMEALEGLGVDTYFPGHRTFAMRGGLALISSVRQMLAGRWREIVPGSTSFFPSWWVTNHPELIQRDKEGRSPYDR